MGAVETDYLVVGAGAAGMAFTDSLVAASDSDVVLVDCRSEPGGHWNDAYPFVRLHQPSAYYGVETLTLGTDTIDDDGPNAGFYERATAPEIRSYFSDVLDSSLLASGRVRFLARTAYDFDRAGGHTIRALDTGETTEVTVRRSLVDATYLETSVPSTHAPGFAVDPTVRFAPVNALGQIPDADGFTLVGGGKTSMDACSWLLDHGVAPEDITWIRPRDSWLLDRACTQPLGLLTATIDGLSLQLEAAAEATTVAELFERLETTGQLIRLDPETEPTMYHCATLSQGELTQLRRVTDVVRMGHVLRIGPDRIELTEGSIATRPGRFHVDCSAIGLRRSPARPIFEPGRITLQPVRSCQPTFNAAFVGHVEACYPDDATKNRLCPPNEYPNAAIDWLRTSAISQHAQNVWNGDHELSRWLEGMRLNTGRGLREHFGEPAMVEAITRMITHSESSVANLRRLMPEEHRASVPG